MKKENKHKGTPPQIPIHPNDLRAIENILTGYSAYLLHNGQISARMKKKLQGLEDIQSRIVFLLHGGEGVVATVTVNDINTIREAMVAFVQIIQRTVPQSSERDETLKRITLLRKNLEKHILW